MKIWTRDCARVTHYLLKWRTFITWVIAYSLFAVIGTVGSASKCSGTTSTDRRVRSSALPLTVSSLLTATTPTPCATSSRDSSSAHPSLLPNPWLFWLVPSLYAAYSKGSKVKFYPQALSSLIPTLFDWSISLRFKFILEQGAMLWNNHILLLTPKLYEETWEHPRPNQTINPFYRWFCRFLWGF